MITRILLVDDHRIMREGLRSLIEKEVEWQVVGEAADGRTAVRMAEQLKPGLVLMDVTMPDMNGMTATRMILSRIPGAKILILSMHDDRRFVAETLSAGASGYLRKDSAFEELSQAIRAVLGGGTYLSPGIASVVVDDYKQRLSTSEAPSRPSLSEREREVLQLIAEGRSTKEIAGDLELSVKTVETYRQQIMTKLGLDNVADLTKYAIREGLTSA